MTLKDRFITSFGRKFGNLVLINFKSKELYLEEALEEGLIDKK